MRKISLIIVGVIAAAGVLTGLYFAHAATTSKNSSDVSRTKQETGKSHQGNKKLIIYFSASGTTKAAAEVIQSKTGADIVRLQPKEKYPDDYNNLVKVAKNQLDNGIHPAIKTTIPNLKRYRTILVGFPTWWHQPPMIIHSLFDRYNFSNKIIVPFTTSSSDPISRSMPEMRKLTQADGAKITSGFRYDNNDDDLDNFLRNHHLNQ
ncbi:flavodoxin [Lentilactobacillus diolivorans]|uniref:Flavodoxin n=2 Tax=Lentilactobacillus diolivorans TaxID=179838 RepID=A0A0R1SFM8_9LACO|nr:flavodoxin [Lentilactobacillus diolivorans]KRL65418.1 flavodoxin [Lentilactobacillus diolivorans DSM 14421]GEP23196.1 flavodoxin [Lentilactobacillus diolivorans]